ncbi:MAG: beta-ketoacyl-ACP synthase II [Bacteroidota bacterium]
MNTRRVVITGAGAITPLGNSVAEFWDNLIAGKSGAGPITRFDTSKFKTNFACEVKGYDPRNHFDVKEARKMDLFTQFAMVAATQAVEDAGILSDKLNKRRVGVIWGSGNGGFLTFQEQVLEFAKGDGTPRFSPFFIPKVIPDIASGWISMKYGFMGPNFITVSACATSTTSIVDAMNHIKWNKADVIIAGGSEAAINESGIGGFGALKALSTRNDSPQTASRPFDATRDGKARGAKIYAEIVGGGMSADAYHLTSTHPEGEGAYLGMQAALEEANLQPRDIDYLNVHATSTPAGDESETKAIVRMFGDNPTHLNISATKSATGHLLGGAGAIEGLISILAVKHDLVPATINTTTVDPEVPSTLNLTLGTPVKKTVNVAMSNTFGFGGHCATLIVKKV